MGKCSLLKKKKRIPNNLNNSGIKEVFKFKVRFFLRYCVPCFFWWGEGEGGDLGVIRKLGNEEIGK
jgi:hypothetical protein